MANGPAKLSNPGWPVAMLARSSLCASSSLLQARPRPAIAAARQLDGDDELRRPRPPASTPPPNAAPIPRASPPVERGRQWRKQQQGTGTGGGHSSSRGPSRGRSSSKSRAGMRPANPVVNFTRQINEMAKAYAREKDSTKRGAMRQHYLQLRAQGLESLASELDAYSCAQQRDASAQPKRRPRWRCNPGFLDLCTAWAQQRFEQFTALDATDLLYSLVRVERDPPAAMMSAALAKVLTSSSNPVGQCITNLVWGATRSLERTQQEAYRLPPAELGRLVQLCVAQWRAEQAVPIPGALRLLDSLPGQGLVLQAADPATAASLAWLADWVFRQGDVAPQAMANALWAFATLGYCPPERTLPELLDRLLEVLGDATPQAIANTLWACATLGYRPPDRALSELLDGLLEVLRDADPQAIANTLWTCGTLGYRLPDRALSELLDRLLEVLGDAKPQEIANTLWTCGTLGYRPPDRAFAALTRALSSEDKLWRAKPQHISMVLWACGELDFMPEHDVMVALLAQFATWLEAGGGARPVPTPQQLRNVLGGCAELQQRDASAQPKRRPRWRCDPGFLDLCTAWAQQRFEQFTALDATDLLYSLVRLGRDPPACPPPALVSAALAKLLTSSSAQDTWVTNLVWGATRCLERTQQEAYRLPPAELGGLVQLCVAQWRTAQAVPIPGALRLLECLPRQGLALQAADPAAPASLAWLAGWVFEQVAALPGGRAQEGFGVDAAASLLNSLTALDWQPSGQQAAAVVALCQWLARRSPGTLLLDAGRRADTCCARPRRGSLTLRRRRFPEARSLCALQLAELFAGAVFTDYDEAEEQAEELRCFLAYSSTGKLYVATDDGKIKCADVRQQLLADEGPEGHAASANPRVIQPAPELQLTVAQFALSRGGSCAAVAGPSLEDPEVWQTWVLDLAAARPAPRPHPRAGAAPAPPPHHATCQATPLDPGLFASRPGLRVLQLGWHPASEGHMAVLTSDNTWRLYNTQLPDLAEQTFELTGLRSRRGLGLDLGSSPGAALDSPTVAAGGTCGGGGGAPAGSRAAAAFAFGPPAGWGQFAVLFLSAGGEVFSLCPVVPFGCHLPAAAVDELAVAAAAAADEEEAEERAGGAGTTEAWLQQAFRPVSQRPLAAAAAALEPPELSAGMMQSVPHTLEEHVPALAGPLPLATTTGEQFRLTELSSLGEDAAQALLVTRYGEAATAVLVATAAGVVGAHLLAGPLAPVWGESSPQCILEGGGGAGSEPQLQAVRSQVPLAAGGTGAGAAPPPSLLLLDVIELGLPTLAAGGGGAKTGSSSSGSVVQLLQDPAAAEQAFCLHPSAAFALRLPWLPVVADALAGAGGRLPAALPAPEVQVLLECSGSGGGGARSGSGLVGLLGGAAVGDPLAGSALVVVGSDGGPRLLRPRRAAPAAAAAAARGGGGAATAAAGGEADREIKEQIDRIYGEIVRGANPTALPAAASGAPAGAASPEGQRRLAQSIAALRSSHVEFQHQAAHAVLQRLEQLQAEAEQQRHRAAALRDLASAADGGAVRLAAAAARAAAVQANLAARLRLLAELHWSLPRPPSAAEQRFRRVVGARAGRGGDGDPAAERPPFLPRPSRHALTCPPAGPLSHPKPSRLEELPAAEAAARQLEADVQALVGRGAALARRLKGLGDAAAAAGGRQRQQEEQQQQRGAAAAEDAAAGAAPPPAQLRRVRELVAGQEALIGASLQRLAVLEGALLQHAEGAGLGL
eukprot:scaffold11.g3857.t1